MALSACGWRTPTYYHPDHPPNPGCTFTHRPFYGNLSGQWPIFGVRPVGERLADWALIEARSPVPSDLSNGNL
jgi:hypothetical protein